MKVKSFFLIVGLITLLVFDCRIAAFGAVRADTSVSYRPVLLKSQVYEKLLEINRPDTTVPDTIRVATGEWLPWLGRELRGNGYIARLTRRAFNRAGYAVKFEFSPWTRAYYDLLRGEVHASAYWYPSATRQKWVYYSAPLNQEKIVFFHPRELDLESWENPADLSGYKIGVTRGLTYTDEFRRLGETGKLQFEWVNSDLQNLKKLLAGRIDVFPCSQVRCNWLLKEHFTEAERTKITYNSRPLARPTGHIVFHRDWEAAPKLRRQFNKSLLKIKEEKKLIRTRENLIEKYSGE